MYSNKMFCVPPAFRCIALLVLCMVHVCLAKEKNVLVIVADDAGFESSVYNNNTCFTPHLQHLAEHGVVFTQAYTSVSSCSPSRSAILTGLPSHQNGMYGLHQKEHHFNSFDKVKSLPNILSHHQIKTGIIGKKHVGPSSVYEFDYSETEENNSILQVGRNISHIKKLTRDFLGQTTNSAFFLYVGLHDPHRCGHTHPQYGAFCERFGDGSEGMGNIPDWHPVRYQPEDVSVPYFVPDTPAARRDIAAQYTTISRLDQGIGLVLNELKRAGRLQDTLVIYTSDNGIPFPNGRTNLYDSGMAVPFIMSVPTQHSLRGTVTTELVSLLDIVPTVLDWYSIPYPQYKIFNNDGYVHLTGRSLLKLNPQHILYPAEPVVSIFRPVPSVSSKHKSAESHTELQHINPDQKLSKHTPYVYSSHSLHEVTMYYPMRVIRSACYKLIHNLNNAMPFPVDQDLYVSPTFQDLLHHVRSKEPLHWFKTLEEYYMRPPWELYDVCVDPHETVNVIEDVVYMDVVRVMKEELYTWRNATSDPWLCAPGAVLEDAGIYKYNPQCMDLLNGY